AYYDSISADFRKSDLSGKALLEWKYQRYMEDYLGVILSVDESVGRILDYLDEKGLTKNTVVIYTSDQGFYLGEHGWFDKRFMYEESLSMPLLMRYPKEIKPGQVSNDIVLNLDFAPTFLDYAGAQIPNEMQGESLRALARSGQPENWRKAMYYHYYEYPHGWHFVKRHYGVRTDQYKLIHFYEDIDEWEFYDLKVDPNEINNIFGNPAYAEIIENSRQQLLELRQEVGDTNSVMTK
ncbi:MAG TPA: DUF4976 domain-containing protein, partial [Candidatus Marinimicrobia bacterium]|nr:DUF4976 domain-containing protein [Candidatus Neomarinimicrobiota bacterium]